MLDKQKIKRGQIAKLAGVVGKITFLDTTTGYVRLERHERWKATGNARELEEATAEEITAYENA